MYEVTRHMGWVDHLLRLKIQEIKDRVAGEQALTKLESLAATEMSPPPPPKERLPPDTVAVTKRALKRNRRTGHLAWRERGGGQLR